MQNYLERSLKPDVEGLRARISQLILGSQGLHISPDSSGHPALLRVLSDRNKFSERITLSALIGSNNLEQWSRGSSFLQYHIEDCLKAKGGVIGYENELACFHSNWLHLGARLKLSGSLAKQGF